MRKAKKIVGVLLIGTLTITSFVGCGKNSDSNSENKNTTAVSLNLEDNVKDVTVESVNIELEEQPNILDDTKSANDSAKNVLKYIYEDLLTFENDKVVGQGASSWEQNDNTYVFKLVENYWTDGQPVKASDYLYSLQRKVQSDMDNLNDYYIIKNFEAIHDGNKKLSKLGVKVINDRELSITLIDGATLEDLAKIFINPVREDNVTELGEDFGKDISKMLYCGPFFIQTWDSDSMLLRRNEVYWNASNIDVDYFTYEVK